MHGIHSPELKLRAYSKTGVFLFLIICLPAYLFMRIRFKRLLAERKAEMALMAPEVLESPADSGGVWPPPPRQSTNI